MNRKANGMQRNDHVWRNFRLGRHEVTQTMKWCPRLRNVLSHIAETSQVPGASFATANPAAIGIMQMDAKDASSIRNFEGCSALSEFMWPCI